MFRTTDINNSTYEYERRESYRNTDTSGVLIRDNLGDMLSGHIMLLQLELSAGK